MIDICIQCGWTISPRRLEEVWLDDQVFKLHRGGCPSPPPNDEHDRDDTNENGDDKNDWVHV